MAVKVVVLTKPQKSELTTSENNLANDYAWTNYGRTATHSIDDTLSMLKSGNSESYAIVTYPTRPSQIKLISELNRAGFTYITVNLSPPYTKLNVPHLTQNNNLRSNDCGAACAAMVLRVNNKFPTVDEIALTYQNPANTNMSFYQIDLALNGYGMDGLHKRPYYAKDISNTILSGKPVIALVWYQSLPQKFSSFNGSHFIAIYGTNGENLLYRDPLASNSNELKITFAQLDTAMYNVVIGGENSASQGMDCSIKPVVDSIDVNSFMVADPTAWRVVKLSDGRTEDVRDMSLGDGLYVRAKGSNGEWWRYDSSYAYLVHDTSPDKDSQGNARVYTIYKNGVPGNSPKNPKTMTLNQTWTESGSHLVQFRAKSDCRNLAENSGYAVNTATLVRRELNYTFNKYGQNITLDEVIWIKTGQETQIYAKDNGKVVGWCGWSAPWGECEISELYWNRGTLTTEPNRYCGF